MTHPDLEVLGTFKRRVAGGLWQASPLDGLTYCHADMMGFTDRVRSHPNRITLAASTGDPSWLSLHGNRPLPGTKPDDDAGTPF